MATKIFLVPNFAKEDKLLPQLGFLVELFDSIENDKTNDIFEINFGATSFCSCFFLGLLHSIIFQLRKAEKVIVINNYGSIRNYLRAIRFEEIFLVREQLQIKELEQYESKSYLPVMHFPRAEGNNIPSEACLNSLLNLIYNKTGADPGLRNDISFIISEITDNVLQHSESETGVILAQYYTSNKILDIVVSDFGQGVFNSYKRNQNFFPETNRDAMCFALEGKSSKDELETRGFGLEDSRQRIMNRNAGKGKFMMWSGNSIYLEVKDNKNKIIDLRNEVFYNGCIVFIRLSC